ncbi:unnamed protein product [Acanthoscelides obtectus]|uniref:Uncharacterized protein n=1 Tax=Acanthoscelides obtectus TaxID=200917 RepID=A0A9P0JWE7_ACAOB|nr:unnamed protein product [Acanthoscelides obtectus]CAK1627977.1 hypothetical protein AOBTE_LOCUS4936 [Acanthoscelides obtectus]
MCKNAEYGAICVEDNGEQAEKNKLKSECLKQKEIECLQREKCILEKLVTELENASQLQKFKIDVYEKELNETKTSSSNSGMLQKTASAESYSQVLKKPLYTNNDSSVLLVKSSERNSEDIFKRMAQVVNPANLEVYINSTRKIKNGVAVICKKKSNLDKFKNVLQTQLGDEYVVDEAKKHKPRIRVKNVEITEDLNSNDQIIGRLFCQNNLDTFNSSDIKVITKLKMRNGCDLILEVSPEVRKK